MTAVSDDPQKQLEWEARQRPRAGAAALLATFGLLAGSWGNLRLSADIPAPSGLEALQRGLEPGPVNDLTSLQIPRMQFILDHQGVLIALGVAGMLAAIAGAYALAFLAVATRARRPELKRWIVYVPIVGGVLSGLATLLGVVGEVMRDRDILDGPRTVAAAAESTGLIMFVQWLGFFGLLASAGAFLIVSVNAMRVGLLTRLLGFIGVGCGVFFILPLPLFGPTLQIVFMAALAMLFFRRWIGELPPAWTSGLAEPWPTRQPTARLPEPAPAGGPAPHRTKRKKRR